MLKKIVLTGIVLLLASCSTSPKSSARTDEWREVRNICEATWDKKIPPLYKRVRYNAERRREIPTGQVTCHTTGYTNMFGHSFNRSNCQQIMRTEIYYVPSVETVDMNNERRQEKTWSCTKNMCLKKYGNEDCEA